MGRLSTRPHSAIDRFQAPSRQAVERMDNRESTLLTQSVRQAAVAAALVLIAHRLCESAPGAYQNADAFGPGDRSVKQVAAEHQIMGLMNRNNDRRILTALALVDRDGITQT